MVIWIMNLAELQARVYVNVPDCFRLSLPKSCIGQNIGRAPTSIADLAATAIRQIIKSPPTKFYDSDHAIRRPTCGLMGQSLQSLLRPIGAILPWSSIPTVAWPKKRPVRLTFRRRPSRRPPSLRRLDSRPSSGRAEPAFLPGRRRDSLNARSLFQSGPSFPLCSGDSASGRG